MKRSRTDKGFGQQEAETVPKKKKEGTPNSIGKIKREIRNLKRLKKVEVSYDLWYLLKLGDWYRKIYAKMRLTIISLLIEAHFMIFYLNCIICFRLEGERPFFGEKIRENTK